MTNNYRLIEGRTKNWKVVEGKNKILESDQRKGQKNRTKNDKDQWKCGDRIHRKERGQGKKREITTWGRTEKSNKLKESKSEDKDKGLVKYKFKHAISGCAIKT